MSTDVSTFHKEQASEDHRGTPEAPGRVVTLIERCAWEKLADHYTIADSKVWGIAYRIVASRVTEVQEYLDIREINGYSIHYTSFYPGDPSSYGGPIHAMVYIGTPDNPQFIGPQDPQELAEHIWCSKGPSGENKEYLFELEEGLEGLSPESGDKHVRDLAARVREIEDRVGGAVRPVRNYGGQLHATEFRGVGEIDDQNEADKA
ncbi:hypothetical protein FGG08_001618 [Glutinoglossum americanum]|uniref:glutathione-specific gamma-glutamylcyclotransferase n=1 Tax=Glutinoglossum americanum TaxID=1670608 RepID=A0A9P8L024_9PEZI|nr:hypothetical protein FGG08_001618 [Glutinoglossum americanum]